MSSLAGENLLEVEVENVGGIDHAAVELPPGVTVLAGRNATNRTSFLQALMAALGSDRASLKGDADEGGVELRFDGQAYTRTLTRTGEGVALGGDPYLEDPTLADLYAFLLESNEARRAVERGDDLREIIMRPVDTDHIRSEIDRLESEKRRVEEELDELDALSDRLPELEERREEIRTEIEETRAELDAKKEEIEAADADVTERRERESEFEDAIEQLNDARSDLEDVRFRLESNRESLASVREERQELEADLDEIGVVEGGDDLDDRIERLREEKRALDETINRLQTLIRFNQEMLEGDDRLAALLGPDAGEAGSGAVTDELLPDDDTRTCWTCGSEVETGRFEETLDDLRETSRDLRQERNEITDELDDLTDRYKEIERQRERRAELQRRIDDLDREIDERETTIDDLETERQELESDIEELESDVEELSSEDDGEVLELHKEANRLEFELDRLGDDLEEVEADVDDVEDRLDDREALEARHDELREELTDMRTRIDRIEADAVERFNEHMDELLDRLAYENLERIWIERRETERREGRRKVKTTEFDLHVVRSTEDGSAYEDTVEHLSESEREVTGLVFALAGYLVHDVHETVPFMLLDSLEAIDAERIARLVDYFEEYTDYLVVALLPEDAAALDSDYHRVADI